MKPCCYMPKTLCASVRRRWKNIDGPASLIERSPNFVCSRDSQKSVVEVERSYRTTTLLLEVFTQRNFAADFIRLKLNII